MIVPLDADKFTYHTELQNNLGGHTAAVQNLLSRFWGNMAAAGEPQKKSRGLFKQKYPTAPPHKLKVDFYL